MVVRNAKIVLSFITFLFLFFLLDHHSSALYPEVLKAVHQIEVDSDSGAEILISEGAEFFAHKTDTNTYSLTIYNDTFQINAEDIQVLDMTEEEKSKRFVDGKDQTPSTLPAESILESMDGAGSITLKTGMDAYMNSEDHSVIVGNQPYILKEDTINSPSKEASGTEQNSLAEQSTYSYDEEKTFQSLIPNVTVLLRNSTGELVESGQLVNQESYRLIREVGNWLEIQFGDRVGYVWKEATKPVSRNVIEESTGQYSHQHKFKADSEVVVYDNSTGELIPFGKMKEGIEYPYISQSGNWLKLEFAGRIGYVHTNSAKPILAPSAYHYISITKENTSVYSNENGELVSLAQVNKGETFEKLRDVGNWYEVNLAGKRAYVWKEATSLIMDSSDTFIDDSGSNVIKIGKKAGLYDSSSGSLKNIGYLEENQTIDYVQATGDWYMVNILGRKAFLHKSAIDTEFKKSDLYYEVTQSNVPFVMNVNGKLVELGELQAGQRYKRVGESGNWHIIDVMGTKAFVWKEATIPSSSPPKSTSRKGTYKLVQIQDTTIFDNSSGSLVPIAKLKKGSSFYYIGQMGNWYKVSFSGREGYIHKNSVALEFVESDQYFQASQDSLPIMRNENGTLIEVGKLNKGEVYKRTNNYGNWHQIEYGNEVGFVWKAATEPYRSSGLPSFSTGSPTFDVTAQNTVSVYDNSSGQLDPIGQINHGASFSIIEKMGNWYRIDFAGRKAFIYGPATKVNARLIVNPRQVYTYEQMINDLQAIAEMYPDITELTTIGSSVDGRKLYALKLGKGSKEILIDGSTHAREHMTTNVVMSMLDHYAYSYKTNQSFQGMNTRKILDETSIWFVPMVNPDGVTLVQKGYKSAKNPAEVLSINKFSTDFSSWKANIRGVDINRQFPADWENVLFNTGKPSPKNYKGTAPFTEPEAVAMANFVNKHQFKATATYHSSGQILYWYFNQTVHYSRDFALATKIGQITGYTLVKPVYQPSAAFQDWFIRQTGFPSFTVEISPYIVEGEVPVSYFDQIWKKNKTIGLVIADSAKNY
ncbi:M14 family metallocarboxypeptidase [Rossellomorea sp. KS-H15a]|uniref:M14 family metallopeptidase n=1 Tax=Rossellomorea sp. KS-H15a TaxID=2963940 RepID=UPI0020C6DC3E|nr:M14 family metallocarboxypeptidase [Rossellomorea sp. KS-H15a]UTE77344.1 M14 family metallocarboxypeptidase [Rossellomorea sp. KS-H15a]